jgi:hypothetical protein
LAMFDQSRVPEERLRCVPSCVRRLMGGLAALGPVSGTLPDPGPWVADAPLWGNPLLPCPAACLPPGAAPGGLSLLPCLEGGGFRTGWLRACVLTPAELVQAIRVAVERSQGRWRLGPWADAAWEAADLARVLVHLPPGWKQLAEARAHAGPASGALDAHLRSDGLRPFDPVPSEATNNNSYHSCHRLSAHRPRASTRREAVRTPNALLGEG